MNRFKKVFVTGGAGYVGSVLVPELLKAGYEVRVLDLYLFGEDVLKSVRHDHQLQEIKGDLRDIELVKKSITGCDAVIHLACISNDPSFELNPLLGKSINYDAFEPLVKISKEVGVRRFIYASSSSVYGISESANVTEEHPLNPITDYSKYKSLCEGVLLKYKSADFVPVIIRPATVCGYSPRQRLDLTVNILTNQAINTGRISIFGGSQLRPNLHIKDMVQLYLKMLEYPDRQVAGKIYNVGYENYAVSEIAEMVRDIVKEKMPNGYSLELLTTSSNDRRSYHISSEKIKTELGFIPKYSVPNAISDLVDAFQDGWLPNSMTDPRYFNLKTMQEINLR